MDLFKFKVAVVVVILALIQERNCSYHQTVYQGAKFFEGRCKALKERLPVLRNKMKDTDDDLLQLQDQYGNMDFGVNTMAPLHSNRALRFTVDFMNSEMTHWWCEAIDRALSGAVDQIREVEECIVGAISPMVPLGSSDRYHAARTLISSQLLEAGQTYFEVKATFQKLGPEYEIRKSQVLTSLIRRVDALYNMAFVLNDILDEYELDVQKCTDILDRELALFKECVSKILLIC